MYLDNSLVSVYKWRRWAEFQVQEVIHGRPLCIASYGAIVLIFRQMATVASGRFAR